ncbi:restriction endonuclease subunit S [Oerskovia enterophila]|uniref:Type-1 restriction enzyme EcoKI specificity protein n=1 Tax=Oerskovia enterophila TaxID=43678 RepID=A0A163RXA3_9CELL|nr:restriction endonuclease subunit S [Oerskovia enterophila]KZM35792.1 type-1 restriction enzyme EcoKI specificity protein [Oerskovia enterophila]
MTASSNGTSFAQWIGALPGGWQVARPKLVFDERRAPSLSQDIHLTPSQTYGVLPQEKYMEITGTRVVLNLEGADNMKHVEPDDFVIHLRSFQGGIEHSALPGKVSVAYTVLTPRSLAEPRFFRWVLKSQGYIQSLQATVNQLRDGQSIKYKDFDKVPLPLPPREEQRAIADFLDEQTSGIDTLIGKQSQLIDTLRERRAASIEEILSRSGGEPTRLKRHAHIQTGVTLSGDGAPGDPEWPYLRVANVQMGFVDTTVVKTLRVPRDLAHQSLLQAGDVLMTEGGDIDKLGRGSLWSGDIAPCLHQNHVFAVRPRSDLDSAFLVYLLDSASSRLYFRLTARKTTNLASTNKWTLGNLPLRLPPLQNQQATVARADREVASIDTLIAKAEEFIGLARERRAALITAAVTGQIDVRTAWRAATVGA